MDIKQKFNEIKEKIEKQDFKKLIGTKAFITVGCVMLVCVAVLISTLVNGREVAQTENGENRVLGNTLLVDTNTPLDNADENANADTENGEDFFAMAILNRTQVRDSALDVLREIADNPDTLPDAKEEALSSIASIADDMSAEANIETLIEAKGISQCVAVISGDNCSIIVNTEGLIADELTQITDIVYEQTGIPVANITVVEAKK
ncbi:MAG: SpoIIIAH-like family protein [Ruminococcaceae bacterium]|nr:SpoIIIAH-like family protein [Oscillospiraceae bacterium]